MTIQPEERYEQLTHRYLSGEASQAEIAQLEEWVQADQAHRRYFLEAKRAWMVAEALRETPKVDVDAQWAAFQQSIQKPNPKVTDAPVVPLHTARRSRRYIPWLAAASVLLLLVAGIWWMRSSPADQMNYLAKAEVLEQGLPDGSSVSLNTHSRLTYKPSPDKRLVQLSGEAFFDVKRDETKPFIIQAGPLEIEVLGTSFNVDAREDSPIAVVTVASGQVAVRVEQNAVSLTADEQVIFNAQTGRLQKQLNQDPNFRSWQTRQLIFEEVALDSVALVLEKQFDVEIALADQALKNCRLTATYTDKSLAVILQILEKTFGLEAKRQGEKVKITGKGCAKE